MNEYRNIDSPTIYIESLIEKTEKDELLWAKIEDGRFSKKYIAMVDIPKTKKYLKIITNELLLTPDYSFLKTEFYIGNSNKITFNTINFGDNEKVRILINSIKNQLK